MSKNKKVKPRANGCNIVECYMLQNCERFEPRSHFKRRLSLIVRVNVVLNRTVVVDRVRVRVIITIFLSIIII